ncbi:DUF6262 family protein [Mycobacterium sp. 3519A]|uniref:DUF6262 family protein n=1 Tax=Mycobacterium sp. 3519A TaxID=2057184 RepID=UPI000C7DFFAD|nr:DUF6262 family protein [Mycobacterium sp. 3519A]
MQADNTAQLRAAAQRRHEQTRERTLHALNSLQEQDTKITVSSLARAAGVARSWIYTQPDLVDAIKATNNEPPTAIRPAPPTASSEASWQQRLELAHDRIKELTNDNAQLRKQLAVVHGQLRAQRTAPSKTVSTTRNA